MPVKKALSLAVVLLSLVGLALLLVSGGHAQDAAETQARGKKVGDFDNRITANMEGMMEADATRSAMIPSAMRRSGATRFSFTRR
jgi:hypothetical protein